MEFEKELKVTETNIPGLLVFDLPVHGDNRSWFKENWQKAKMTALGLPADFQWPIPLEESERSEADLHHPMLKDAKPMVLRRTLVTGANGQLGRAIREYVQEHGLEGFEFTDIDEFYFSDPAAYAQIDWSLYGTIINAGAYTAVDKVETPEGRAAAWKANAQGPALLAKTATEHNLTLVHISSDYVFDGVAQVHDEEESFTPLGVYGQTKAAGDIAVATAPKHYILCSSWVIGDGHNFVKTMISLSDRVANPDEALEQVTVVDDQIGRLTFTQDMARAIFFLLEREAPYGTYDLTLSGDSVSWAAIAREVFAQANVNAQAVAPINTEEYFANATVPVNPRPAYSTLDLAKIEETGIEPSDWRDEFHTYVAAARKGSGRA
ncbi:SDR family oxidoreductase [Bifidobacterium pseudolongum]|uniref:dTDP-4-dehydrorhamnose reductase n=1 Tax=Bifidobacterium pseudolongum subsp. globosum TaxID=1690 RepID=A0A4Q5A599_9BIFI|nr:NAD(P)-dependent oxidoreductase [Bifidobacterium pseudolongum]RYQ17644.1 dTDP-4-dehydrorhamnose reductase [Bifidobacterium pseudolongum subsp. globosum]